MFIQTGLKKITGATLTFALFGLALGVRLIYLNDLEDNPLFDVFPKAMDHSNFDQAAVNFVEGDWLARSTNNSFSPLYKYFLGMLYWISGKNYFFVYLFQFVLGACGAVLVFRISTDYFGFRAGLFAYFGMVFFTTHIIYEGVLLRASFISFLGLWSFYLLNRLKQNSTLFSLVCATLVLSLFFQARPNTLLVLPAVFLYLHFNVWKDESFDKVRRNWTLFLGVLLGSFIPLLVQCYLVNGRFVLFDASGPHTFISGNLTSYSGVGFDLHVVKNYQRENVLNYASNIRYLVSHIADDPLGFFGLYLRKLFFFFNDFESPTNISVYLYREFSPFLSNLWNHFALFSSLGLIGIVIAIRKKKSAFFLYTYIVMLSLAILIFLNESRYRIPVVPYFIIFSGYALDVILTSFQRGQWSRFISLLTAAIILLVCFQESYGLRRARMDDFNNMAYAWIKKNRLEKARVYLDRGLVLYPADPKINFNKGQYHFIKEEWKCAEKFFKKSLELDPDLHEAQSRLSEVWFERSKLEMKLGRFETAIGLLRRFLESDPESAGARANLGVCYAHMGLYAKAREQFLKVLVIDPENGPAKSNLSLLSTISQVP